jgi:hypothetical protein
MEVLVLGFVEEGGLVRGRNLLKALQNPVLRPKCPKQLAGQLPAASRGAVSYISQNVTALPGDKAFLQPK